MRRLLSILATAICLSIAGAHGIAQAAFVGIPTSLKLQFGHIRFDMLTLAPMAHTRFCLDYPQECMASKMVFRGGRIKLTSQRLADLVAVNAAVNASIEPERNDSGGARERWVLSPARGDCNDYAVTKRHALIARGWPPSSLLLAEVVTAWGQHHLVVVVRTNSADLVIDNLSATISSWSISYYRWVRIQTPENPMYWARISSRIVRTRRNAT